ncbi:MAG: hypothetical protein QXH07_03195 [Thermoplasmata archaeon]
MLFKDIFNNLLYTVKHSEDDIRTISKFYKYLKQTKQPNASYAVSIFYYVYNVLSTVIDYKTDNVIIGNTLGKSAYTFFDEDFFSYAKFVDQTFFNAFGVALGLSYKSKVKTWLDISDSQLESGIFHEFLQNFNQHHNLLVTIDHTGYQSKSQVKEFISVRKLLKQAKVKVYYCDGHDLNKIRRLVKRVKLPAIIVFITIKGYSTHMQKDPIKYNGSPLE